MKKIEPIKVNKIWGYEKWLYSPLKENPTLLDGKPVKGGPLIKIIKADAPLSVQVHPDDNLAKELENQPNGKSESWYILSSEPGSTLVLGLKDFKEENIRKMLVDQTFEDNLLLKEVKPKEFYDIPAGLIHGIGAGIKLFEVQQPSDVTYRYYDYNRLQNGQPRELHVDKAIRSQKDISYDLEPTSTDPVTYENITGKQIYSSKPITLESKSIVVDLDNEVAYMGEANEEASFKSFCIIPL